MTLKRLSHSEDEETKSLGRWSDKVILSINKRRILGEFRHTLSEEKFWRVEREEERGRVATRGKMAHLPRKHGHRN